MKVLFVCTGNTCRSVMAEAIFNNLCKKNTLKASSAGISIVPHSITSLNSIKVVKDNLNCDLSNREAIQINEKIIEESDLVLTMTSYIKGVLSLYFPKYSNKIFSLNEYLGEEGDILDPYGGNLGTYTKTFFQLKNKITILIDKINEDKSI